MKLVTFTFLVVSVSIAALGQTNTRQVRELSLEDCLEVALAHNLSLKIKRYDPDIARLNLAGVYGAYDPSLSVGGSHNYGLSPGGVDAQGRPFAGNELETDSINTALQGFLPWGLSYSLGGNFNDTYGTRPGVVADPNSPIIVSNTFFDVTAGQNVTLLTTNYRTLSIRAPFESSSANVGFLTLRQPLLKNFWVDSTRLQIYLDKQSLKSSEWDLRSQIMTIITSTEQAYYNLIYAQDNIKVQEKALQLAEQLLAENRKRVEVGALAPLDEKQSEAQAASSRADLLAAQGTEDTQQRVLKNLISDDYSKWKDVSLRPTATMVAVPQKFDLQESWRRGLTMRPDVQQQRLSLTKQEYVVKYSKNQVLPQLDLVGSAGYSGTSGEFSGALYQVQRADYPSWSYGAQMTIPLSQTSARNNLRAAKASKEQIELQLKQLEQQVLILIEDSIATANTSFLRVNATREARIYAEAALEAEQKKLDSGKSTSFEVLRLQRDLTTARSTEIRALADYNIALAQLALNEGSTLERQHVALEKAH
jgi:outer membrane protein TolC